MKRLELENKTDVIRQIRDYTERNPEAKFIHRLQVVLMYAEKGKETFDSLGSQFGNSPRSISNWIKKLNRTGVIESLRCDDRRGRPSRLTRSQKHELRFFLSEEPGKQGESGKRWNGTNLSRFVSRRYGVDLSVRTCQLYLRGQGFHRQESGACDKTGGEGCSTVRKRNHQQY
jgi:transposase